MQLFFGLITGLGFGILLQRAEILRFDRQLGALLLEDMTIVKFMLSAICTAMIGIHILLSYQMIQLSPKALLIGGDIIGGLLFGIGWALLGYCPATSVGALAEGRWDAVWGIAGALAGAALFAACYPWLTHSVLSWGSYGKITLPAALEVSPWWCIGIFTAGTVWVCIFFERNRI